MKYRFRVFNGKNEWYYKTFQQAIERAEMYPNAWISEKVKQVANTSSFWVLIYKRKNNKRILFEPKYPGNDYTEKEI